MHACLGAPSLQSCVTPCTAARQAPLSMGFSRQEYWSGLPCSPPGDPPDPGMEPVSLTLPAWASRFFTISTTWEALIWGDGWQMLLLWLFGHWQMPLPSTNCSRQRLYVLSCWFFFFPTKHPFSSPDFYCRTFPFPLYMRDQFQTLSSERPLFSNTGRLLGHDLTLA